MRRYGLLIGLVGLGVWLLAGPGTAQEKVATTVTDEKLEKIFKDLELSFKKVPGKKKGVTFFDYVSKTYKIRLHNYEGKDLWIDALFNDKTTLEKINLWNVRAKFTRAVLLKGRDDKETISLEFQLNCQGGVTDGMIRQFIRRFDGEIKDFVEFLGK
jgi:hypothetical protein